MHAGDPERDRSGRGADLGFVLAHEHVAASSPGIIRSRPALHDGRGTLVERGTRALTEAKAAGVDVLTVTLPYKSRPADLDDVRRRVDFVTNVNDKVVPQIDGSPGLRRLPVVEMLDSYYWLGDFSLVGGVVLHDYLAGP